MKSTCKLRPIKRLSIGFYCFLYLIGTVIMELFCFFILGAFLALCSLAEETRDLVKSVARRIWAFRRVVAWLTDSYWLFSYWHPWQSIDGGCHFEARCEMYFKGDDKE